jgi:hypothetical protein
VHLLLSYRAPGIGLQYLTNRIIASPCAKAGVPTTEVRGNITSHRVRSTIATQPYNAKEPMTCSHSKPGSKTARRTAPSDTPDHPNHTDQGLLGAGYFERNLRTIEVLVDRDVVTSVAAAAGEPWRHYDLGHGY